jgi:hypothetical protein
LVTGTCFIQKIYAPSSSLLQGKYLPFSTSPLRLNIFCLFVKDTATSGLRWIFHMHSEFSRPAMCKNAIMIIIDLEKKGVLKIKCQ